MPREADEGCEVTDPEIPLRPSFPSRDELNRVAARAPDILLEHQLAIAHHEQPGVLRATLRELPRLIEPRQIHPGGLAYLRRVRRDAPAAGAVGWREVGGGKCWEAMR